MVAELTWLDEMRDGEERAEDDADAAYDDVCDAKEGILAAHDGAGRDDDRFCAAVFGYVEICWRGELVCVLLGVVCEEPGEMGGGTYDDQYPQCRFQFS